MARRKYPLPEYLLIWGRHEDLYRRVFSLALRSLHEATSVSGNEDHISEQLCPLLARVCFRLGQNGIDVHPPQWEKPQQPQTESEVGEKHIAKRPDFACSFLNPLAKSPEEYSVPFHVECKLLGDPTSRTWVLNRNYVTRGIARFDLQSHKYGNRAPSGMMVGYMISMTPEEVQAQVNACIGEELPGIPQLAFTFSDVPWQSQHRFARRHVMPTPFTLIHLWVDLRKNYDRN